MCMLGWAIHKTHMESRDLVDTCQTLLKRQGFDLHEAFDIYMLF